MTEKKRVEFDDSPVPDFGGFIEISGRIVHEIHPKWRLKVFYPIGSSQKSTIFRVKIDIAKFQNNTQIKNEIMDQIRNHAPN